MSENNEKSITYIKNDKYLFNIIKIIPISSTKAEKIGLTIYKKTLEINKLNKDCIDLLLSTNSDFKESYANLGFINILGVLCFVYASDNDVKEKLVLKMDNKPSYKICRIDNFHCFIISYNISSDLKKKVKQEFEKIGKFLINEELYFCNSPFRFDLDVPNQLNIFEDNFFKYKLIEKYQYNQDYYPKICEQIMTPLVKGFYKRITYNSLFNEKDQVYVALRYKIYAQNKYLIEVEMFIVSNNNQKIFENLFYVYFNESKDKIGLLKNVIDNWDNIVSLIKKNNSNIKSGGLIINLNSNIMDDKNVEIKNKNFQSNLKDLTDFEFINLKNSKDSILEDELYNKHIDKLKSIGFNFKFNGIDYNSQNKLLILTGNDFDHLFSLIKIVAYLLYSIYLKSRGFQKSVISNAKEEIFKNFKHFEKKILKHRTQFTKKPSVNIVNNLEEFKSKKISKKNDITNNELVIIGLENQKEDKVVLVDSLDDIDNLDKNNINKEKDNIESCENKDNYSIDEDNSNNINIDKIINDINKPKNLVNNIKETKSSKVITLFIGTFNVNALESELIKTTNLSPFLFPEKLKDYFTQSNYPTFYVIGLEETIELNPKNILINPKNKVEIWEERISKELQERYNYFLYSKDQLVGVLFLFFVKPSEIKYMKNKHMEKLKSGFMGCGNKGCCFFDFEYKGASYGFCSAHLPAGQKQKNFNDRKEVFRDILDFKVNGNDYEFYKNDFFFIFGDLNFRTQKIGLINLQNHIKITLGDMKFNNDGSKKKKNFRFSLDFYINKNKEKPKKKKMDRISSENVFTNKPKNNKNERNTNSYEKDKKKNKSKDKVKDDFDYSNYNSNPSQYNNEVKENAMDENIFLQHFFKEFLEEEELKKLKEKELFIYDVDESEISFPPTYKYVKGTSFYNLSKRVPSWTDRILFKKGDKIRTLLYDRVSIHFSDHKPIIGLFEIDTHE